MSGLFFLSFFPLNLKFATTFPLLLSFLSPFHSSFALLLLPPLFTYNKAKCGNSHPGDNLSSRRNRMELNKGSQGATRERMLAEGSSWRETESQGRSSLPRLTVVLMNASLWSCRKISWVAQAVGRRVEVGGWRLEGGGQGGQRAKGGRQRVEGRETEGEGRRVE
jgi:hypothetical protein